MGCCELDGDPNPMHHLWLPAGKHRDGELPEMMKSKSQTLPSREGFCRAMIQRQHTKLTFTEVQLPSQGHRNQPFA